jgi:hypothetical protein
MLPRLRPPRQLAKVLVIVFYVVLPLTLKTPSRAIRQQWTGQRRWNKSGEEGWYQRHQAWTRGGRFPSPYLVALAATNLHLQDEYFRKPDIRLSVPEILKAVLVDDWEAVTKNNQVSSDTLSYIIP